ncbi:hypothetical protein [Caldinitratiruptor microaerophilus]|uniref:Uncharacterized protein n=1 Tax=Caldinitratiruptor microaerophilus TaxID=671077 RepID=A0AA35CL66_9FIRM|nr:hypothetical protein [Caldinitratiruptor microaerophilus]BDG59335.1 hypothetical protein caldi_04250 [Caldinitratiruptor microaerophilus]
MLDQRFFREELPSLMERYQGERPNEKIQAELLLQHGVFLRAEGPIEAGPSYIAFDYQIRNEKRRAVVPYDAIIAVSLAPAEKEKSKPGLI